MPKISPRVLPSTLAGVAALLNGCQSTQKIPQTQAQLPAKVVPSDYAQNLLQENKPQEFKTQLIDTRKTPVESLHTQRIKEKYSRQSEFNAAVREIKIREQDSSTKAQDWQQLEKKLKDKGFEIRVKDLRQIELSRDEQREKINATNFIEYLVRKNFAKFSW